MPWLTAVGAAAAAVTLTVPADGSSTASFRYLSITLYNTLARTGVAAPVTVTTTNLNSLAFTFPSAGAVGTVAELKVEGSLPMRAAAAGAVTVVCPATTSVIWRVNTYYEGG